MSRCMHKSPVAPANVAQKQLAPLPTAFIPGSTPRAKELAAHVARSLAHGNQGTKGVTMDQSTFAAKPWSGRTDAARRAPRKLRHPECRRFVQGGVEIYARAARVPTDWRRIGKPPARTN